jgi:NADH-quinone oxidoreductase subunit J
MHRLLFLLLNAPFLAMIQLTVYAGAIMVLFLFVIMLLGAEKVILPIGGNTAIAGLHLWRLF